LSPNPALFEMKKLIVLFFLLAPFYAVAQQPTPVPVGTVFPERQTPVHDPVIIKEGQTYYLFCTGMGISVFSSKDTKSWKKEKPVFEKAPDWTFTAVPGFKGHIWAPDISFHNGLFYLYYSVSAFGKNTSAIGVAVNKTLDRASPDFGWVDKGKLLQSVPNRDMWNAIDPNLAVDEKGIPWLIFGSFWEGIKMVKLDADFLRIAEPQIWFSPARRRRDAGLSDSLPGNGAIEAPFIYKRGTFYYLFVSVDYCCRAEKSDYKIAVGRSEKLTGPYLDKNGADLFQGGGSIVRQGDKNWYGVGHNAVYQIEGKDYLIYHRYDAADKGRSKLLIEELTWTTDGWPE
jgi:arabinan endo-1,5-alpha-L-arabinosidase